MSAPGDDDGGGGIVSLHMTAGSEAEAVALARALVEERLVACVNVLPGVRSIYRWEGRVHDEGEVVLLAKTRAALVDAVCRRVGELHSYAVPCVVALPVVAGHGPYLAWVAEQTAEG